MHGLWKENLGGWNAKDCKRKNQSRKNTLRDKGRVLLNAFYKDKDVGIWEESEIEIIEDEPMYKQSDWCEIWSVVVGRDTFLSIGKSFYAIEYNGKWYDYITYDEITSKNISQLTFIKKEEFQLDKPKKIPTSRGYFWASSRSTTFIYGCPIPDWKISTFYNDGKRRKIAQKMASASDRAIIREWIGRSNWDAEIGTHALSKGLGWYV